MSSSDSEDEVEYETEKFYIADHVFELTTVSYMPIERLLDLQSKAQEISGQKLWCGSLCVMEYLIEHPEYIKGFPILELGVKSFFTFIFTFTFFPNSSYKLQHIPIVFRLGPEYLECFAIKCSPVLVL